MCKKWQKKSFVSEMMNILSAKYDGRKTVKVDNQTYFCPQKPMEHPNNQLEIFPSKR